MLLHSAAAAADIIWHAMKPFRLHPSTVIKVYVTLICENVFLFSTQFTGEVQCNEIDAFLLLLVTIRSVMLHSTIIYIDMAEKYKFLIDSLLCTYSPFKCELLAPVSKPLHNLKLQDQPLCSLHLKTCITRF